MSRKQDTIEIIALLMDSKKVSKEAAMDWFRNEPIPAFGCRTAKQMVYSGDVGSVKDYIEHLATGGYS